MISRRRLLGGVAAAATMGTTRLASAEPPPEVTTLNLSITDSLCQAPQNVADELFKAEGFSELRHRKHGGAALRAMEVGETDIALNFAAPVLIRVDVGAPIIILGGGHVGCLELHASKAIRSVSGLKEKKVVVYEERSPPHIFLTMLLAHVGLNHHTDVETVTRPPREALALFEAGKVDAIVAAPPVAQELRAKRIGHVVVNSTTDRPWSQYFCCVVVANRSFARKHPVATKRAMRAILKASDVCGTEPEQAARTLVDRGFTTDASVATQVMKELPYREWRSYNPEDAVRFYALRLHEAGFIKSNPKKIIADGTDWRFFNELRKELKG